jgi:hypothetical protein
VGPVGVLLRASGEEWGREEVGSGMLERFQLVARPYEIKTQNKGVQGY